MIEELALFSTELLLVIVLGLISLWGFIFTAHLLIDNRVEAFDGAVHAWLTSVQSPALTAVMHVFTALGNPQTVIIPILMIIVYFLFVKPHRWYAIRIPVVALGSYLMNRLLKAWFNRPRPDISDHMTEVLYGLSFPSGHAMFAAAFYGLLLHILWKSTNSEKIRVIVSTIIIVTIFMIGLSRVYLKVHYATDVLAGFAAGFLWLLLCLYITRRIEKYIIRREKRSVHSLEK